MPRTVFDDHAKDTMQKTLSPYGKAETDARITAETQYADLRFVLGDTVGDDAYGDFLTRELQPRMLYEFAHDPPDVRTVASWHVKRDVWFLAQCREARRKKVTPPTLPPTLVALSASDPVDARRAYRMHDAVAPGVYAGDPSGTYRLVVINQLPETLDTLRARTMGRGATLLRAIREVEALPDDSKLGRMLVPQIATLRIALERDPSQEAREIVMNAEKILNKRMEQQLKKGLKEGLEAGLEKGLEAGLRTAIEQVCEARGLKLTAAQRATLAAESRQATLQRWLNRAATATSARDVFPKE